MLPRATAEFRRRQRARAIVAAGTARREWAKMGDDFDSSWSKVGPRLTFLVTAAQLGAAREAVNYVPAVLHETKQHAQPVAEVQPEAFAGVASDGRPLEGLLYGAVTAAKSAIAKGADVQLALQLGGRFLEMAARTQVADAGRTAAGVAIAARPDIKGYVRVAEGACCDRCAVLVGETYKWSDGFERHPGCECVNVPVTDATEDELREDPQDLVDAGRVQGLSDADQKALDDGASLTEIVNARGGLDSLSTAGADLAGGRWTPEQIYEKAEGDRDRALTMLQRFGYLGEPAAATAEDFAAAEVEDVARLAVAEATAAEPELTAAMQAFADRYDGNLNYVINGKGTLDFRLKSVSSLARKMTDDMAEKGISAHDAGSGLFDINRYTTVFTEEQYAARGQATLDDLRRSGYIVKEPKNFWRDETNPYQGVNLQITSPSGVRFELQFHTGTSLEVKEGELHKIYEIVRAKPTPSEERLAELRVQSFAAAAKIPIPPGAKTIH